MDKGKVGERIEFIRWKLTKSQTEFGAMLSNKARRGVVSHWEIGDQIPRIERLKEIAKWGNVSCYALLNGEPKIDPSEAEARIEFNPADKEALRALADWSFLEDYDEYRYAKELKVKYDKLSMSLHLGEDLIPDKKDRQNPNSSQYKKFYNEFDIEKYELIISLLELIESFDKRGINTNGEFSDIYKWRLYYLKEFLDNLMSYYSEPFHVSKEALHKKLDMILNVPDERPPFDSYQKHPGL